MFALERDSSSTIEVTGIMADGLYGIKQSSKTKAKEISSSTSLSFSSSLASLISNSTGKSTPSGRARSSKSKSDIFASHNKNVKKRAAADMLDDGGQKHKTTEAIGAVDSADLERAKRRMQEKVKRYDALRRGEHDDKGADYEDRGLVDFDRKWAESEARGGRDDEDDSEASDDSRDSRDHEVVEYTDEFSRLRKGTRGEARREERRKNIQSNATRDAQEFQARPSMPSNVIYGDAVQHNAFNPDQVIADRMAEIAKKRDKSATPPPDTHFDARAEVRTKGTAFYNFSHDAEERKRQMDALEADRNETERLRSEREHKKAERKRELEERKRLIAEQRSKAQAEKFLSGFDLEPS